MSYLAQVVLVDIIANVLAQFVLVDIIANVLLSTICSC